MKKQILIVKNATHENSGVFLEVLQENGLKFDIIDLSQKIEFPKIEIYGLLIIMGGSDSANDTTEKILKEVDFVKQALKSKIPIFGICLGLQLIIKALGGKVFKNPTQEIGFKYNEQWNVIKLNEDGLKDPIFRGISDNFKVFHLHGETVELIDEMQILGTGKYCKNQVIKFGEFNYGFQFHIELTETMLEEWIKNAPELRGKNIESITNDFKTIREEYSMRGKKIFTNYLKLINLL